MNHLRGSDRRVTVAHMIIDGFDQYCRYLSAPGSTLGYHFGSFLKKLNISLGEDQLREFVQLGWIQPILRVHLPERFFLAWENYPSLSFEGDFLEEDLWATRLWNYSATSPSLMALHGSGRTCNWYTHYLDDPSSELYQKARAHAIPTGPGAEEPPLLKHPHGNRVIYPWIDFFAYWQAYELVGTLQSIRLVGPLLDSSNVEARLDGIRQHLPELRQFSRLRRQADQSRWQQTRPVFEWVSRFRTLLGAWTTPGLDWKRVEHAAPCLLDNLRLTPQDLRLGIRDVLLVQWERWRPKNQEEETPKGVRAHLQQDIQRAVEFLTEATGQVIDYDDPFWGFPEDLQRPIWAPLPEALPYESLEARREFPFRASIYLEDINALLAGSPLDETALKDLTSSWWPRSVALRRFCLAFQRLHGHLRSDKGDKIGLRAQTPIEFLLLCVLHAEKILRDRYLEARPGTTKLPSVTPLIVAEAGRVLRASGFPNCDAGLHELEAALKNRGRLHDLQANPRNPFVTTTDFSWGSDLEKRLLVSFANLGILRNYAAHHDCLDEELQYSPLAETVVEAVLLPTLMVLGR
jgi:hypothetical protein